MSETETKVYDVPEVLAALEAAVAKRGEDWVYVSENGVRADTGDEYGDGPSCRYVHHRDTESAVPGCIVGQVYYDLTGRFVPDYAENTTPMSGAFEDLGVWTRRAARILARAQAEQDSGETWGQALAAAKALEAEV